MLVIASRMGGGFMVAVRLLVLTTVALRTAGAPTAPTKHIEGHLRPAIRVARRASASECAQGAWARWRYGGGSAGAPSALARPHGGAVVGS